MIDPEDIISEDCAECSKEVWMIIDRQELFCCQECAAQFVINHNVDEAERKGER